ncbi:MAG: T9SS type A sorting domain-containing protein [Flavobacteriales bacterium]
MKNLLCFLLSGAALSCGAQWSTITLDPGRVQITGIGNADRAMAVGGFDSNYNNSFDILDYHWGDASYHDDLVLSEARYKIACAINGNLLITAGGINSDFGTATGTVEIFDLSVDQLVANAQLSQARLELGAAAVGTKVLFAGGLIVNWNGSIYEIQGTSDVVDIYDVATETWSTATLSQARGGLAVAVSGTKAFFAGGYQGNNVASDVVDIYDAATDSWSTATLSQARAPFGGGAAVGTKVMFAGGTQAGINHSDVVDIYDMITQQWSTATLSVARCGVQAAVTGSYALFAGGGDDSMPDWSFLNAYDAVDIYNAATGTWSTATMSAARINFAAAGSANKVFLFGGVDETISNFPTVVDVFTDASQIGINEPSQPRDLDAWPNPFVSKLNIGALDALEGSTVEVYDARGAQVASVLLKRSLEIDLSFLNDGLYELRVLKSDGSGVIASGSVVKAGR